MKLFDRVPTKEYICVGDLNAHHTLWSSKEDERGRQLETLLTDKLLVVLNEKQATMASTPYTPDLALATPALGVGAEWRALENSCGSDHLQVITTFQA